MALETSLRRMGLHIKNHLDLQKGEITTEDGHPAFAKVVYGEPKTIVDWPLLSVQPDSKLRSIASGVAHKFRIDFFIDLVLYHGKVADTLSIQNQTHERVEAIEEWLLEDVYWNFVDQNDTDRHKVIFGFVARVDHPVVIAPGQELWSASRLRMEGRSQEVF